MVFLSTGNGFLLLAIDSNLFLFKIRLQRTNLVQYQSGHVLNIDRMSIRHLDRGMDEFFLLIFWEGGKHRLLIFRQIGL